MRVVFMGTPDFSVPSLQALLDAGHEVAGVFTQPDRPKGRGGKVQMSPVKELALKRGIAVYQPIRRSAGRAKAWHGKCACLAFAQAPGRRAHPVGHFERRRGNGRNHHAYR